MSIKFLHLNIMFEAYYIENIIKYIRGNDFDIINLQEVAGGSMAGNRDIYALLQEALPDYNSKFVETYGLIAEANSYLGNAVFYKSSWKCTDSQVIWLKPYAKTTENSHKTAASQSRAALHVTLTKDDQALSILNTHLAWGPTPKDEPYKLEQAKKLFDYFKQHIHSPFIFSGDFNLTPDSEIVRWFGTLGRNLTIENHLTNTLNPRTHKASHLFPPGLTVDYIYIGHGMDAKNVEVIEEDLSDHLGIRAEIEF